MTSNGATAMDLVRILMRIEAETDVIFGSEPWNPRVQKIKTKLIKSDSS